MGWLFKSRKPAPARGPLIPFEEFDVDNRLLDMRSLIRQASTRVSVDQLLTTGKRYIHVLSSDKIQELIDRSVTTIVDKHLSRATVMSEETAAQIAEESKEEFQELLKQYKELSQAKSDVERSRRTLDHELEELRKELEAERAGGKQSAPAAAPVEEAPSGSLAKENSILQRRLDKLGEYVASLEAALKTLSNSKMQSAQQINNVLRQLGLANEDKFLEKKKEALKLVLETNQTIRHDAKELAAKGISLASPGRLNAALAELKAAPRPVAAPVPPPIPPPTPVADVPKPAPRPASLEPAAPILPTATATMEWSLDRLSS